METPKDGSWARFVDGESVDPDEIASLLERARIDATLRAQLLDDVRVDGWMRGLLIANQDGDTWAQAMAARLVAEQTRDAFVARVTAGIEGRGVGQRLADWLRRGRAWGVVTGAACAAAAGWFLTRDVGDRPVAGRPDVFTIVAPKSSVLHPAPRPLPEPTRTLTGSREIIRAFDFEDGDRAPDWHIPPTRLCPPHTGSRFCLKARKDPDDSQFPDIVGVRIENRKDGIFVHEPGTVIAFDYWLGQSTVQARPRIAVWLSDDSVRANYHYQVDGVQAGRWVHVEIPVDGFRAERPNGPPVPTPGSRIGFMLIQTSWSREDVLFIDDVRFERPVRPIP